MQLLGWFGGVGRRELKANEGMDKRVGEAWVGGTRT